MSDGLTFQVNAFWKLPKGENGLTSAKTIRLTPSAALNFILDEMIEEADDEDAIRASRDGLVSTIVIDWSKLPDSVTRPPIPVRRR